jgi:hypothetical protein
MSAFAPGVNQSSPKSPSRLGSVAPGSLSMIRLTNEGRNLMTQQPTPPKLGSPPRSITGSVTSTLGVPQTSVLISQVQQSRPIVIDNPQLIRSFSVDKSPTGILATTPQQGTR